MPEKISIGIDIGGTNAAFGAVDLKGNIISQHILKTSEFSSVHLLATTVFDILSQEFKLDATKLRGIGIGSPAANAKTGCIHHSSNLPWKGIVPIQSAFESIFHTKVRITNDANASAMGERTFGGAKGLQNFAVITLGTGVGSGIYSEGHLIDGFDGNGGEFGHTVIQLNGRQCGCSRKGCLETYTSAKGIKTTALELSHSGKYSSALHQKIQDGDNIESKTVFEYALNNDELAIAVFNQVGAVLGLAIANLVTLMGLEKIILFGGPVQAGDVLLEPIRKSFQENVIHFYHNKIRIEASKFPAKDAAILGAASLVFDH